jgi:hypothetical protein
MAFGGEDESNKYFGYRKMNLHKVHMKYGHLVIFIRHDSAELWGFKFGLILGIGTLKLWPPSDLWSPACDTEDLELDQPYHNPKWIAPETKPHLVDKALDGYILRHAPFVFREPLNGWTDDFADYFNQILLAPSQYRASFCVWSFSALGPETFSMVSLCCSM